MRKVELNMKEKQKYEKIKEYVDHGGNKKCCLHLAVDKATNTIVGGWFDK